MLKWFIGLASLVGFVAVLGLSATSKKDEVPSRPLVVGVSSNCQPTQRHLSHPHGYVFSSDCKAIR